MEKTYIVMAKQVPDTKKITGKAMKEDGTVNRAALPTIFNPDDMAALEMALRLKDQYGGKVVVLTMGPPSAVEILRQSLYRGVDKCILLTDRKFAGSDTLATSMVLSHAIKHMGEYSLILSGRQAIDGDTAQVGPQVAEKLDIPQITYVEDIVQMDGNTIEVKRIIENGFATQSTPMPALLTCCATSTSFARPCSAKRIQVCKNETTPSELTMTLMKDGLSREEAAAQAEKQLAAKTGNKLIEEWDIATIKMDEALCGLGGSPTWVKQIESVVLGTTEHKRVPANDAGIAELVSELISEHIFD